jgi:hypothetical protein
MSLYELFSAKRENLFERFPDIKISADPFSPTYRVKYTECVKEKGVVRFDQHEKTLPKESLQRLIEEICKNH